MTPEEELRFAYLNSVGEEKCAYELSNDPAWDTEQAKPVRQALLDFRTNEKELYFSFLKEMLQQNPADNRLELDRQVAQAMYRQHVDYVKIMRCLAYSPNWNSMKVKVENRMMVAVHFVTNAVNPLAAYPMVQEAKPTIQLDFHATPHELYHSYLKHVFDTNPALSLAEADKEIVKLLKSFGISRDVVEECLKESMQFINPNHTGDVNVDIPKATAVHEARRSFLQTAWDNADGEPEVKEAPKERTDNEIYTDMIQQIKSLHPQHDNDDLVAYWQNVLDTMQKTLNQLNQVNEARKVLQLWTMGIRKASKELGVQTDKDFAAISKHAEELLQNAQYKMEDFTRLYEQLEKMEVVSRQLIQDIRDKQKSNPILKEPKVQHARLLSEVLQEYQERKLANPQEAIYYAAIRQVALSSQGESLEQLEEKAIGILQQKLPQAELVRVLMNSPRQANLDLNQKIARSRELVEQVIHPSHTQNRGGTR